MKAPKTTKLGTKLSFTVYDFQGEGIFPVGSKGLAYEHLEQRTIKCKYTGLPINRNARYVIYCRAEKGWQIDQIMPIGPSETVYGRGDDHPTHWTSAKLAAQALSGVLDEIEHNSSIA